MHPAGELTQEIEHKRRLKPEKAWDGQEMTWVVQYHKKKCCLTYDIITEEFRGDQTAATSMSESESDVGEISSDNGHERHQ